RIRPGDLLWRTHDPDLDKLARRFTQPAGPVDKQPLHIRVIAHEGAPLEAEWALAEQPDVMVTVRSTELLARSQNRALAIDVVREQFGRLGNTPYALADVQLDLRGSPFAPSSLLNGLRRRAVDLLAELQGQPRSIAMRDPLATLEAALARTNRA